MNCASGMRANDSLAGQLARVCPVQLHALITSSSTMQCTLSSQPLTAACRRWAAAMARRPSQPPLPRPCAAHSSPRLQDQQGAGDAGWAGTCTQERRSSPDPRVRLAPPWHANRRAEGVGFRCTRPHASPRQPAEQRPTAPSTVGGHHHVILDAHSAKALHSKGRMAQCSTSWRCLLRCRLTAERCRQ